jgi:hypothetical protein
MNITVVCGHDGGSMGTLLAVIYPVSVFLPDLAMLHCTVIAGAGSCSIL